MTTAGPQSGPGPRRTPLVYSVIGRKTLSGGQPAFVTPVMHWWWRQPLDGTTPAGAAAAGRACA